MPKAVVVPHPEPGVHLTVSISGGRLTLHHVGRVRHAPRRCLRPPILNEKTVATLKAPAAEVVLSLVSLDGRVVDQFGWPYLIEEFFDCPVPGADGALTGSPVATPDGFRLWRVPVRENAQILLVVLARARVAAGGPGPMPLSAPPSIERRVLACYWLGPGPLPAPPHWPPPDPPPIPGLTIWPTPIALPAVKPLQCLQDLPVGPATLPPDLSAVREGLMASDRPHVAQHGGGAVEQCFNIVVVGDGFQKHAIAQYDDRVDVLVKRLKHIAPFSRVWDKVNVWSVRAWSQDSGISIEQFTDPLNARTYPAILKTTHFGLVGAFRHKPNPGYVGTYNPCRILEAAATVVPLEYIHLVIPIANISDYGGHGVAESRMAFVTMWDGIEEFSDYLLPDKKKWGWLVAHECGHAIAALAEERIVGVPKNPTKIYPNQATLDEVDEIGGQAVSWTGLATATPPDAELDSNGKFVVIHRYGDLLTNTPPQPDHEDEPAQPDIPQPLYGMLGAFWGCQSFDAGAPENTLYDGYRDAGGQNFFRPMSECRMRRLEWEFCRVCDKALADRITETCV